MVDLLGTSANHSSALTHGDKLLTPFDEYPIHNSALPVAQPATADPNHYDRCWFNGVTRDGDLFFSGAMGHYPVRNVVDAAFSVIKDGVQYSLFSSGRMPADRSTVCGPLRVEVVEPLKTIRFAADETDGLGYDLTFRHRSAPIEEPRAYRVSPAGILLADTTRLAQWGTWEGVIHLNGEDITIDRRHTWAMRDRSWGVRPIAEQITQNRDATTPKVFWLWAPMHFDDRALHFALNEEPDGRRWLQTAHFVPVEGSIVDLPEGQLEPSYELQWEPGTRRAKSATLRVSNTKGNEWRLELETLYTFYMRGIGYWHPTWGHGTNHGILETGREQFVLADFDPADLSGMHIQNIVRARLSGPGADAIDGIGVLEQVALGDHAPTGLTGLYDMVPGT